MMTQFIHVQYCFDYLVNQIPMGLLLYSHVPTALIALSFGAFVLYKSRSLTGLLFFLVCMTFTLWSLFDLSAWFSFLGTSNMMFSWSLLDFVAVAMFFFSYYFLYSFLLKQDLPMWQKLGAVLIMLPTATVAFLGWNLTAYNANWCEALEDSSLTIFTYYAEAIFLAATLILVISQARAAKNTESRSQVLLAGGGVLLFLGFFFSATFWVSNLATDATVEYAYNYLIYGLFGMPVFLAFVAYLIVRYKAFNLKIFGTQALVIALLALVGSQFAFVETFVSRILVSVTLIIAAGFGYILIRSVKLEILHREEIEKLAQTLDETNGRQETLIHFIGHEVKGFLTKDSGAFAALLDGDFGTIPDTAKPLVEQALASSRNGADSVATILKASNLKKGTVAYEKKPFDMKELVTAAVERAKSMATQKSLSLVLNVGEGDYKTVGDGPQINDHVLRNLIENAINYTPSGKVEVSLSRKANRIVFAVKDSGVGITEADKKRLFTEGGHGENSQKVNAHSTGYGLFIAKQITEAHAGTIRADSEGEGKGSTFTAEFPVVKEVPAAAAPPK